MTELLRPTARECVSGFIVARLGEHGARPRPLSVGLAGPQGSGKTRLLQELERDLCQRGLSATALSLDDFYLTRAERQELSRQLHPLFMTRGVPGTHDVAWLERVLLELGQGDGATWPRFDKAADDRCPRAAWHRAEKGRVDVVLLEGWCLGLPPQTEAELVEPQNRLERECDVERVWRTTVNRALATNYAALFGELDLLVALVAPGFEVVFDWRRQQEADLMLAIAHQIQDGAEAGIRGLGASVPREPLQGLKRDDAELSAFIAHFERLTKHGLACWPSVADLSLFLDETRHVVQVAERRR